jgi:uncharacterized protein (DUF58 family)
VIAQAELASRVRQLELRARKAISHLGAGAYRSAFKGHGIEFHEIREYTPGDDVRTIDWNVTARHGRPYVKRFAEEREQTILLLVDGSSSTHFRSKRDVIAEVAATLAFAAIENEDKVGLVLFGSEVECYVPPGAGGNHALRIVHDMIRFVPRKPGTDIVRALQFLDRTVTGRVFAFLISDFFAPDAAAQIRVAARRHNLIALSVNDGLERELPACGLIEFEDSESGSRVLIDSSDRAVREAFSALHAEREQRLFQSTRGAGVDHFAITAGQEYFPALLRFLRAHAKRRP